MEAGNNSVKTLMVLITMLISVAFLTLMERKLLSLTGTRLGPNKPSFQGILQPILDAAKLMNKQNNNLTAYSNWIYYITSFAMMIMVMTIYSTLDKNQSILTLKYPVIMMLMILGLNSLNMIYSGWSTNSKYSLMGSIRSTSQIVSYEGVIYTILFFFFITFFSYSLQSMPNEEWMISIVCPILLMSWIPSILAELNRTPYDFSEGESELVSGFNIEHGSLAFTILFLAEYSSMIFFSYLSTILFFSQSSMMMFSLMILNLMFFRALLPRFRFDKLMSLCWKFYLPFLTWILILYLWMI